jgi:glutathione peroxidase
MLIRAITIALFALGTGLFVMWPLKVALAVDEPITASTTAYDFSFTTLTGNDPLPLSQFRGNVILVVNTASQCGFTPQYEGLEKLYERYKDRGLVIVGVPSNDFGQQEPGSGEDIAHFCKLNYGVTFPMAAKEHVTGDDPAPFYKWARERFGFIGKPKWNFHKYLINRSGLLVDYFHSTTKPDDPALTAAIEKALDQPAP